MFTEIDHVAIAVNDLEAAIKYYGDVFGAEVDHREVVESDGVEEALLKVAESYIQLLTPTRDDSPVAKAIENGSTTRQEKHLCENGQYRYGDQVYRDWKEDGWEFTVVEVERRRIEQVRVVRPEDPDG